MAGLESIALAVAHLERIERQDHEFDDRAEDQPVEEKEDVNPPVETAHLTNSKPSPPPAASAIPMRCNFGSTPSHRVVSMDMPAGRVMGNNMPYEHEYEYSSFAGPSTPRQLHPHLQHGFHFHHLHHQAPPHGPHMNYIPHHHVPHPHHHAYAAASSQSSPRLVMHPAMVPPPQQPQPVHVTPMASNKNGDDAEVTEDNKYYAALEAARQDCASPVTAADIAMSTLERILGIEHVGGSRDEEAVPLPPIPPPSEVIAKIQEHDVKCGRGGETNHHSGNVQYRQFVKACQPAYIAAKRRDKPRIAERIVLTVRKLGGRFLKKDAHTNTWRDVGNTKAREKTSQALREGAPDLRHTSPDDASDKQVDDKAMSPPMIPSAPSPTEHSTSILHRRGSVPTYLESPQYAGGPMYHLPPQPSPTPKKRRISGKQDEPVLPAPAWSQASPVPRVNAFPMKAPPEPQQPSVPEPRVVSCSATISADDEESSDVSDHGLPKMARGPRIKLLKRRLESYEDSP